MDSTLSLILLLSKRFNTNVTSITVFYIKVLICIQHQVGFKGFKMFQTNVQAEIYFNEKFSYGFKNKYDFMGSKCFHTNVTHWFHSFENVLKKMSLTKRYFT